MGSFSDRFKKTFSKPVNAIKDAVSGVERLTRKGAKIPFVALKGKGALKAHMEDYSDRFKRSSASALSLSATGRLSHTVVNAFNKAEGGDGPVPPSVTTDIGAGSSTNDMTRDARSRAIAASIARRRKNSTTATSALGLVGQGAQLGYKRLTGV